MEKEKGIENWSETVKDLVDAGDVESAISLLESVVQTLDPSDSASQLPLASALSDLADLYSSKGFSREAADLQFRASLLKQIHHRSNSAGKQVPKESNEDGAVKPTTFASRRSDGSVEKREELTAQTSAAGGSSDEGISN